MPSNDSLATIAPPKACPTPPPRIYCELCPKSFGRKGDHKRHMATHTGEKEHICHYCQKAFAQRSGLTTHINTHTGAKPYACKFDGCSARFGDPSSCARHKKETHRVKHPYRCCHPGCVSSIKRRSAFKNHLLKKHGIDPDEVDIDAMAKPKKSSSTSRRKSMPSPHVIVSPAPPPFMLQSYLPEADTRALIESPTRYDSQSPHHVWYEPTPSAAAEVRLHEHYTAPMGSASFYQTSETSTPSLLSYDSVQRLADDALRHSPSRADNHYSSLWSGSTLVGDEYYSEKHGFVQEDGFAHKGDYAHKAEYVRKDDYAYKNDYDHKDVYDPKALYYSEQQPSPTYPYSLRHMSMPEPVPAYQHQTSPTSSPPPYAKITLPRLDSSVSIVSADDLEGHRFAVNPSKIYGAMEPPRYGQDQEAEFAANNYPAQWSPPPAWQY